MAAPCTFATRAPFPHVGLRSGSWSPGSTQETEPRGAQSRILCGRSEGPEQKMLVHRSRRYGCPPAGAEGLILTHIHLYYGFSTSGTRFGERAYGVFRVPANAFT